MIKKIVKRDGRIVTFNMDKITDAIFKAAQAVGGNDYHEAERLASLVCDMLEEKYGKSTPSVEQVQDVVEYVLSEAVTRVPLRVTSFTERTVTDAAR